MIQIRPYNDDDKDAVVDLWRRCGLVKSWNDPYKDIDRKISLEDHGFLVSADGASITGSIMVGYDGHRGWVNYLAVSPDARLNGLGRQLMAAAEEYLLQRDCPKLNLQLRRGNQKVAAFYQAIGYCEDDVVSFGKRLIKDQEV